ncbi:MAG: MauE/DoxX family redox-associated membrane protein [Planctomycetota bacterium]
MSFLKLLESIVVQLALRIGLGGVFCFAAFKKLSDPQSFAEAIKGFKVLEVAQFEPLMVTGAFVIPWVEMIAGLMLVFGLRTRAAASAIGLALVGFIGLLISIIARDIDASCSCFGDLNFGCPGKIGWCQVLRNTIMLMPAIYLVWRQGGLLALDEVLARRADRKARAALHAAESTEQDPIADR